MGRQRINCTTFRGISGIGREKDQPSQEQVGERKSKEVEVEKGDGGRRKGKGHLLLRMVGACILQFSSLDCSALPIKAHTCVLLPLSCLSSCCVPHRWFFFCLVVPYILPNHAVFSFSCIHLHMHMLLPSMLRSMQRV